MHYKQPAFLFFFILPTSVSNAPFDDCSFVRYTTNDGLSDNYITAIQQEDRGCIRVGTGATGTGTVVILHPPLEMK